MKSEDCIFFQLSRVSRAGARYWQKKVAGFGVTSAQALVLICLFEEDHVTSAALGARIEFDSATLTGLIDRLEKSGFVERKSNPEDRRAILVCLTNKGKDTARQLLDMVEAENNAFLHDLTKEEAMILRSLLKKIA